MPNSPPATILVVDDDETGRRLTARLLRLAGFEVREAATGGEALRLAEARPDLLILDVQLPDASGFEVCRAIKANPATASALVLHLSGVARTSADRTFGLEGGADGYLTKPIDPDELIAARQGQADRHGQAEGVVAPPGDVHHEPVLGEPLAEVGRGLCLVLDDQNLHGRLSWRGDHGHYNRRGRRARESRRPGRRPPRPRGGAAQGRSLSPQAGGLRFRRAHPAP